MQKNYPAVFTPDDGGFVVTFPDLPGCVTEGDDLQEAFIMAVDAATGWAAAEADAKRPLPEASSLTEVEIPTGGFIQLVTVPVPSGKKKVSLTLDDALLIEIDRRGLNRSGFVNDAAWSAISEGDRNGRFVLKD